MSDLYWFPFEAVNFMSSTNEFTLEETGAYIRLMCHQWDTGGISLDPARHPVGNRPDYAENIWPTLQCKFVERDGRLVNLKLEAIRVASHEKHETLSEAGKAGAAAREANRVAAREASGQAKSGASSNNIDNDIDNDIDTDTSTHCPEYPPNCVELANGFYDYMFETYPLYYPKLTPSDKIIRKERGADAIDKLIRINGYEIDFIRKALWWASKDSFWNKIVRSLPRLRVKVNGSEDIKFISLVAEYESKVPTESAVETAEEMARGMDK